MCDPIGVVVTGTNRFSLGEAICREVTRGDGNVHVLAIDRSVNDDLSEITQVTQLECNLNALDFEWSYRSFGDMLLSRVRDFCITRQIAGIDALVSSAGIYTRGSFASIDSESRQQVLGVNLLAKCDVLYTVMKVNKDRGVDNRNRFAYIDVGSRHGMTLQSGRVLYSATKAFGLDLCAALSNGGESARAIYLALGPIDTHMLHRNHWVNQSDGSKHVFQYLHTHGRHGYEMVFIKCDLDELCKAYDAVGVDRRDAAQTLDRYRDVRESALSAVDGIVPPESIAREVAAMILSGNESGVCMISPDDTALSPRWLPFDAVRPFVTM